MDLPCGHDDFRCNAKSERNDDSTGNLLLRILAWKHLKTAAVAFQQCLNSHNKIIIFQAFLLLSDILGHIFIEASQRVLCKRGHGKYRTFICPHLIKLCQEFCETKMPVAFSLCLQRNQRKQIGIGSRCNLFTDDSLLGFHQREILCRELLSITQF